ncbi:hypothetical protein EYF80_064153 [Liparis tanakae]|uniref:Uncharacterized protein n=1 Tax=Liparis tanakae TaxID=230148 RepID=A0A4Z2EAD2_9TELE|nr:hypothetical protein EYF80_064153 [Liparis tanakae]
MDPDGRVSNTRCQDQPDDVMTSQKTDATDLWRLQELYKKLELKTSRGGIRYFFVSAVIIGASPGTQGEPCPEGGDRARGRCCCLPGRRTAGGGMERPLLPLLLSELRVGNAACDVSLSRSLLGWKRRPSGPVYRPFRPSKTRMCVSGLCARVVSVGPFKPRDVL